MQSRDVDKDEFFKNINGLIYSEKEEKELKEILIQIEQINRLINETKQKRCNYNYFKRIMLPSDYRKIKRDLTQQVDYKVYRETYKLKLQLQEHGKSEEEIDKEVHKLADKIYKFYKIRKPKVIKM